MKNYRVASAVDVHAFDSGRELWLGCKQWPEHRGLAGHSDADVLVHAICDAMLIASNNLDIGEIFGVDDPMWKDATGEDVLKKSYEVISKDNWEVVNCSVQVIGEIPRIAPRRLELQEYLTNIINCPVTIGATSTDSLGFLGRKEGLCALATVLLSQK